MDQNFRKRLQKTLCCGELEPEHCSLSLTELAVEYFQDLAPHSLDYVDLQSASSVISQDTVSPSSVAMSMVYAKRLQRKRPDYVTSMSSSDLFIISMMMASKYLYDEGVDEEVFNDEWAQNSGLETDEMNSMERDFLDAMDWELFIRKEDFDQAMLSIERRIALREGLKRGWFSYTDLDLLLDESWMQLLGTDVGLEWLQVVVVSSAAYVAGIMTMVGSTVLVTNACVGLSSMGLLPVLLPVLHITPVVLPRPLPALCHHPLAHCPEGMSPPVTDVGTNETTWEADGEMSTWNVKTRSEDEEKPGAEEEDESRPKEELWTGGQSVVDTILSQLMAVLTLKTHLAQFVYAVSDSYVSRRDRNQSERKVPQCDSDCCMGADVGMEDDLEISPADPAMRLCGMEKATAELDWYVGPCLKCGKEKAPRKLGFNPPLQNCLQHHHGSEDQAGWKDHSEWMKGLTDELGYEIGPKCFSRTETRSIKCCWESTVATTRSLFPDIVIGFSTSMPPPVFAT